MYAMQEYNQRRRKRKIIIGASLFIVVAAAIACIVAASVNKKSDDYKNDYASKYAAEYNKTAKEWQDKYAKKYIDKYGSSTTTTTTEKPETEATEKTTKKTTTTQGYNKYTTNSMKSGSALSALRQHFDVTDAADVTWAHAVNSKAALDSALGDEGVMMLEADVMMDPVNGVPIMAHPPANSSDICLEVWLKQTLVRWKEKGIKLDFKQDEALNASVPVMQKIFAERENLPPIILNADIMEGPNTKENETTPLDPELFFTALKPFTNAILSPGWTTKFLGANSAGYNRTDANAMTKLIQKYKVQQDLTFPVRASLAALDPAPMHILVNQMLDKVSLTVWTSKDDTYDPKDLGFLRLYKKKVFYDLPADQVTAIKNSNYIPDIAIPGAYQKNMP